VFIRPIGRDLTSYREIQINLAWFAEVTAKPLQVFLREEVIDQSSRPVRHIPVETSKCCPSQVH